MSAQAVLPGHPDSVDAVIQRLNERSLRKYRARHPDGTLTASGEYVALRLRQGYTEAQLLALVDTKADEWGSSSARKYLRPETLFRWQSKFDGYMAEAEAGNDGFF